MYTKQSSSHNTYNTTDVESYSNGLSQQSSGFGTIFPTQTSSKFPTINALG